METLSRRKVAFTVAGIVLLPVVVFSTLLGSRHHFNVEGCKSNLRQIGEAIGRFAADHGGRYPDSISALVEAQKLDPSLFVCPSTVRDFAKTVHAEPGNPKSEVNWKQTAPGVSGEHLGYDYHGRGLTTTTVTPQTVVVSEPLEDHDGKGMYVLFGDGRVEWIDAATAERMGLR